MTSRPRSLVATAVALAATLALVALSTPAFADSPADPRAEARAHFLKGQEHQQAGRYDEAIAEYQAAYSAAPMPALLFNLGQAYRLKGDKHRALAYYKKYVAAEPNAAPSIEAQQHIESLVADLAAEEAAKTPAIEARTTEARATDARATDTPAPTPAAPAAPAAPATPAAPAVMLHEVARPRPPASAGSRLGARLRADMAVDLEHPGATVAAGLSLRITPWLDLDLDALLGTQPGGYLGASLYLGHGAWRPMLSAGAPVLLLNGTPTPGVHGAAGLRWDPTPRFGLFVIAGAFWLPSAPDGPGGFNRLVWSPSLGLQRTF